MFVNSSSASNSNNIQIPSCSSSKLASDIGAAYFVVKTILTLPVSVLVIYQGHQRWRQQRSFKTASHSDIFTYNATAMELLWVLGCLCFFGSIFAKLPLMITVSMCLTCIGFYGETILQILTSVERYLAVVHPVTYLRLRNAHGVRIRNISIGCVWLLCFGWVGITLLYLPDFAVIPILCFSVFSLVLVSFCSLSILCVLTHPGPGEGGRERQQVDQSKHRAFHIMTAITGALCFRFVGVLVSFGCYSSPHLSKSVTCVLIASVSWCNLPSSLVLPLLFLHRAGKLSCHCSNREQRHEWNHS